MVDSFFLPIIFPRSSRRVFVCREACFYRADFARSPIGTDEFSRRRICIARRRGGKQEKQAAQGRGKAGDQGVNDDRWTSLGLGDRRRTCSLKHTATNGFVNQPLTHRVLAPIANAYRIFYKLLHLASLLPFFPVAAPSVLWENISLDRIAFF